MTSTGVGWLPCTPPSSPQTPHTSEFLILQPIWTIFLQYAYFTSSPVFPVVISVACYFLCQAPFTVLDICSRRYPSINKYKIQPNIPVTWAMLHPALVTTVWNHLLYIVPATVAQWAWLPGSHLPPTAPTLWQFCWHQYAALVIFDVEFYLWHVLHHKSRFLYRHIHSVHHRYTTVTSWATQYVHPWEMICIGMFSTTAPWILNAHPLTNWCFMALILAVSVEDHCGYDLPLFAHHWAPFWGGAPKHDIHHRRPMTNFQPYFNWFDRLFGSEVNTLNSAEKVKHTLVPLKKITI